jgi:hypothetical protein
MKCGDDWCGLGACVPNHSPFLCCFYFIELSDYGVDYADRCRAAEPLPFLCVVMSKDIGVD